MKEKYTLEDFNFDLPEELIAQYPAHKRDESKLLLLKTSTGETEHHIFHEITDLIRPGDVLVFNNAKVIHGRLFCRRETGGTVEIILTQRLSDAGWLLICNRTKRIRKGEVLTCIKDPSVRFKILDRRDDFLEAETTPVLTDEILDSIGQIPLPPYIKRNPEEEDESRYQTVYASHTGAVAAPTAGLHFTDEILDSLREKNVQLEFLTLYVSWGTFQPVRENDLSLHKMHTENYVLSDDTAARINQARREGRRIIAVGTTSLRVLEASFVNGENVPGTADTDIFICPPGKVHSADCLITNFHTPCSTLLMLVSAFAGYELIMKTYKEAVARKYRFFSYGDAMFIQGGV